MSGEISPGELARNYSDLKVLVSEGFARLEVRLDKYVLQSVHDAEMRGLDARIADIERDIADAETRRRAAEEATTSRQRWVVGLLATILLGVIGLALTFWSTFGPPQIT